MAGMDGPEAIRTRQEPLEPPARLAGLPTSYQPARTLPAAPRRALERVEAPEGPTDAQAGARSLPKQADRPGADGTPPPKG